MLYEVAVPAGFASGQTFQCEANGMTFDVTVPEGSRAHDLLSVDLPFMRMEPDVPEAPEPEQAFVEIALPIFGDGNVDINISLK